MRILLPLMLVVLWCSGLRAAEVTIDLTRQGRPFRGWGTSLAWWAHGVGDWPEETIDAIVRRATDPKEGLGLTVFRYNIGGGDAPDHHHMRQWGDVPGFKASADAPFDPKADLAQRRVLLKLIRASADRPIVEAFSNSPPYWMTISGCAAGAVDGSANLQRAFEQPFVDYLADVAAYYKQQHGVTFDSLEPMNEPDVKWWKAKGNQEGAHIPRDQQARLIVLLRQALDRRGLKQTRVSATDANNINAALKSLNSFDEATLAALGQVNTHSYKGDQRPQLRKACDDLNKPLWQSETGPLYVGGTDYEQMMKTAERLVIDMNQLRPEVWCTWQFIAGGPWGCLNEDAAKKRVTVSRMFYLLAAFTREIRPGDRFVEIDSNQVLAAESAGRKQLTVVLVNREKTEQAVQLLIKGGDDLVSPASRHVASATDDLAEKPAIPIAAGRMEITMPAESVTRLVLKHGK